mgnify:CR=1 FL=1
MPDYPHLPQEALVELVVSNGLTTRLICTPSHLGELVTGWLFTQGVIETPDDILSLQICDFNTRVLVQIRPHEELSPTPFRILLSSGCSGGSILETSLNTEGIFNNSRSTATMSMLVQGIASMYDAAFETSDSSGLHCAAIISLTDERGIVADSDIGRHNAVDKVIGGLLTKAPEFGRSFLVTSGRVSSDMVLKAIRAGIPIVATRRSVTSLAADLAAKTGVTIAARLTRNTPVIVGNRNRIVE